ncbi:hypothetical protein CLV79_1042 [Limimaricola soesokkakensis]|uniref:Uncharacterized protein n=1 Tax=Limimaricola soesokkakensis TaxID=1343159 RepID=A0A1X6Z8Z8_9RHOB|nr:hypothetical protein [Limimaricola soesokkakensis]PSK86573.1 hypothetical protein CLV79_1042 [Limimaricola soesokkakensis]SLN44034.1 hypothetical protein LOS8367_01949 [Limimaricola soesokkakensis]
MNLQKLIELIAEQAAREVIASTRRLQGAVWSVLRSRLRPGNKIERAPKLDPQQA